MLEVSHISLSKYLNKFYFTSMLLLQQSTKFLIKKNLKKLRMVQRIFNLNFLKDIESRDSSYINQMKRYRKSNQKQGAFKKLKT